MLERRRGVGDCVAPVGASVAGRGGFPVVEGVLAIVGEPVGYEAGGGG